MSFKPEDVPKFLSLFAQNEAHIAHFAGCKHLQLVQYDAAVFFTISYWDAVESLDKYRNSVLFNQVWTQTKCWFNAKPEAWTTTPVQIPEGR